MKQKFLVINCDETDVDELRRRLGGRNVVSCESIDEIAQYLPSPSTAVLVSSEADEHPTYETAAVESSLHARSAGHACSASHSNDVDELVERVLEQNNGHAKTLAARVDMLEQKIIEYSLIRNGQHRKETAAELGISRVTLYNKMKKFGLLD